MGLFPIFLTKFFVCCTMLGFSMGFVRPRWNPFHEGSFTKEDFSMVYHYIKNGLAQINLAQGWTIGITYECIITVFWPVKAVIARLWIYAMPTNHTYQVTPAALWLVKHKSPENQQQHRIPDPFGFLFWSQMALPAKSLEWIWSGYEWWDDWPQMNKMRTSVVGRWGYTNMICNYLIMQLCKRSHWFF